MNNIIVIGDKISEYVTLCFDPSILESMVWTFYFKNDANATVNKYGFHLFWK